jgi:hypothetical protein
MALNCEEKLTADIIKDCDNIAKAGLEVNAVLINFDDIDKTASTLDVTNDLIITNLATKSGTSGYSLEGIKQSNGISFELVKREDTTDGYKHTFAGVILTPSAANKKLIDAVASGGRYVVVVEKKFKGANQADAFEVLGWASGLEISTVVYNSKEAGGAIKFELSTVDGEEEDRITRNNLETDYATTKTAFDSKYATA